jgi:hypothetical protein
MILTHTSTRHEQNTGRKTCITALTATEWVNVPLEQVFEVVTCLKNIPTIYAGSGPLPTLIATERIGGELIAAERMCQGGRRRLIFDNQTHLEEEITVLIRPLRLITKTQGNLPPPLSRWFTEVVNDISFTPLRGGTRISWTLRYIAHPNSFPMAYLPIKHWLTQNQQKSLQKIVQLLG